MSLSEIRSVSAMDNVANSFHVYSIDSKTPIITGLAIDSAVYTDASDELQAAGPLTNGQILIGSTGSIPLAGTITAGSNITVTNSAGGITIAATAPTPVTQTISFTWSGPVTGLAGSAGAILDGQTVIMSFPTAAQAGNSSANLMTATPAIPSAYWPRTQLTFPIQISNDGVFVIGQLRISTGGNLTVAPISGGNFTSSASSTGYSGFGISYTVT